MKWVDWGERGGEMEWQAVYVCGEGAMENAGVRVCCVGLAVL